MTDPTTQLARLIDREEIAALSHRFARALDGGTVDLFLSAFTSDVDYSSGARHLSGHAALSGFFNARAESGRLSRHMMSGLEITFADSDSASGRSVWLTFAGDGPLPASGTTPFMVADVHDHYRRTPEGWKIAARYITPVFRNDAIPSPVAR